MLLPRSFCGVFVAVCVCCILVGMDDSLRSRLVPGAKVIVTQQIAHRIPEKAWMNRVAGTVVEYKQKPTGSWYAHAKNEKLWLDRLKVQKEDGELTTLILDEYSHVEVVGDAQAAGAGVTGA
jgi:hypothetical protein